MREVEIPGGTAFFLEADTDSIPGRAVKVMRAAGLAAATQLSDYPELFEPPREGETDEEQNARIAPMLEGMKLTTEQAMSWDNMREATVVGTLHHWTLDRPLPTLATIGDLPSELYVALLDAVGGVSAANLEADFEMHPERLDDKGEVRPFGNSGSSDAGSKEGATPSSASRSNGTKRSSTTAPTQMPIPSATSLAGSEATDGESSSPEPSETTSSS